MEVLLSSPPNLQQLKQSGENDIKTLMRIHFPIPWWLNNYDGVPVSKK